MIKAILIILAILTVFIIYIGVVYWMVGVLATMVYPMITTTQKIALTLLATFIFGLFKTNISYNK